MWPHHPTGGTNYPPLPLIEGTNVVELMPDQRELTARFTERAVKFIGANREKPFFLYLAHVMPHVPLYVSEKFAGRTKRGRFGDVIEEVDWSVGKVLEALKEQKLEKDTLVVFTSDNGPWLSYGDHAGSAGPLREGKGTSFDGGVRVPFIASWPGRIPEGAECSQPAMTIDLLPTIARLVGAPLPSRKIDGLDIWPLLSGTPGAKTPHEAYWFYWGNELHGIRSGEWKLHLPHDYIHPNPPGSGGRPGKMQTLKIGESLFHLGQDPRETNDVSAQHPEIVKRLRAEAEKAREELGDALTKRKGSALREASRL
jgi:arylsulfatase A-like enzyme